MLNCLPIVFMKFWHSFVLSRLFFGFCVLNIVDVLGVSNIVDEVAEILSRFSIGNTLLLKPLRTLPLPLIKTVTFFKKGFF